MRSTALASILEGAEAAVTEATAPADPAERADLAQAAESAGATILEFAAVCRGEADNLGVCPRCGKLLDPAAGHNPFDGCLMAVTRAARSVRRFGRRLHRRSRFWLCHLVRRGADR